MIKQMFERFIKYLQKLNNYLLYEDMKICLYCKYWGVVNWCNLHHKQTCSRCSCDKWEPNND